MVNNNYPQISSITSESLQAQIRNLLPSQEGFGTDLMAQNVIVPVIDLTSAAEGSTVRQDLQTSWDFATGHTTITGTSTTIITNTGFWKVDLTVSLNFGLSSSNATVRMTDGLSSKTIWRASHAAAQGNDTNSIMENSFVVFVRAGDSINAGVSSAGNPMEIWYRQIADVNGNLTNPLGFTPQ